MEKKPIYLNWVLDNKGSEVGVGKAFTEKVTLMPEWEGHNGHGES